MCFCTTTSTVFGLRSVKGWHRSLPWQCKCDTALPKPNTTRREGNLVSGSGVRAQSADRIRPSIHRRSSSTVDKIGLHRNRLSRHSTSHGDNQTGLAILSKSGDPWQDWTTFDSSSTNDETRPLKRPLKSLTKKLMPGSAAAAAANSTALPIH